jgi:hypothetical protein
MVDHTCGLTRRRFVGAAAAAAAAIVVPPALGSRGGGRSFLEDVDPAAPQSFVSQPDLRPPAVTVSTAAAAAEPGSHFLFVAPFRIDPTQLGAPPAPPTATDAQNGPLILDQAGEPVWFHPLPTLDATDFKVQRYRGQPVLTWYEGHVDDGHGYGGSWMIVDGAYRKVARVRAGRGYSGDLHELVITSRNTALIAISSEVITDLSSVGGTTRGRLVEGVVQELELPSGRVLFEWHSSRHVPVGESYMTDTTKAGNVDYFHINSIGVDTDGNLLISSRHTCTVYKVDRRTGDVIWRLGGRKSDFRFAPGAAFNFQHDVRRVSDGTITLFDNGASAPNDVLEATSRGLRLSLDTSAMTASLLAEYRAPDPRVTIAMGSMQLLPDSSAFVGWGTLPYFSRIGADGKLLLDAELAGTSVSYRAFLEPWVGRPETDPSVAVRKLGDGRRVAYVSWNGATEVDHWQLFAGARSRSLRAVRKVVRRGFETPVLVPSDDGHVSVVAYDSSGRPLGASRPARA